MFLTKIHLKYDNLFIIQYNLLKKNNEFIMNYISQYRQCDFKLYKEEAKLNQFNIKHNFPSYTNNFMEPIIDYKYLNYKNNARLNEFLIQNNFNENKLKKKITINL